MNELTSILSFIVRSVSGVLGILSSSQLSEVSFSVFEFIGVNNTFELTYDQFISCLSGLGCLVSTSSIEGVWVMVVVGVWRRLTDFKESDTVDLVLSV